MRAQVGWLWDKWEKKGEKEKYRTVLGGMKKRIIDDYDQDKALIIGQGTKAGPFQSIMMKPPNAKYIYPLRAAKDQYPLPDYL